MIGDKRYKAIVAGTIVVMDVVTVVSVGEDGSEWASAGADLRKRLMWYSNTEAEAWQFAMDSARRTMEAVVVAAKEAGHAVVADGGAPGGGAGDVG